MSIRLLIIAIMLAGCSTQKYRQSAETDCELGSACSVSGRMEVDAPWESKLRTSVGCIALALPEAYYAQPRRLAGKAITVSGYAMSQPEMYGNEYFYEVDGRRVNMNQCRFAIVVDKIWNSRGETLWEEDSVGE
jgi:hypothetical protein